MRLAVLEVLSKFVPCNHSSWEEYATQFCLCSALILKSFGSKLCCTSSCGANEIVMTVNGHWTREKKGEDWIRQEDILRRGLTREME